jgi:FkbM family methyltransferase
MHALEADHVIDVGANEGQYARIVRSVGFAGRIDSVEPIPDCAARLRNAADAAWHVHECALGAAPGTARLNIHRESSLSSLHEFNTTGLTMWGGSGTLDVVDTIEVPVRMLDQLLDDVPVGNRIWVKVDTQGHDLDVLAGLTRFLPGVVAIQSEVAFTPVYEGAPAAADHIAFLDRLGFAPTGFFPITRVDDNAIVEADAIFVRRQAVK